MPMLIWVAALSGYMHKGPLPNEWEGERLTHDPAELEGRLERQRKDTFGRRRYEELKALEAAAKEAERKAAALKKEQDRLSAIAAVAEARRIAREARESASYDAQQHIQMLQLRHALEGFNSAKTNLAAMSAAHLVSLSAMAARHNFDDDEEAMALLLLH